MTDAPDMEALVQDLVSAWSARSPAEQAAFAASLDKVIEGRPHPNPGLDASAPEHPSALEADLQSAQGQVASLSSTVNRPPPHLARMLDRRPEDPARLARRLAALSGEVAPRDLVRGFEGDAADAVLNSLAPEFDRVLSPDGWRWTLRHISRRTALADMKERGEIAEVLSAVGAISTDKAGGYLRYLARGEGVPWWAVSASHRADPSASVSPLVQALVWAQPLGGLDDDLAEARRLAALAALRDAYGVLLRHGLVGRMATLRALRAFARRTRVGDDVPVLTLTGIGGAGKSTVLAALARPLLDRQISRRPGPVLVLVDLDRTQFRVGAEVELVFEVLRQLGTAEPEASPDFAALRRGIRSERRAARSEVQESAGDSQVTLRDVYDVMRHAHPLMERHGLHQRSVLLMLDTFEAWQRERQFPHAPREPWNDPERRILEWVSGLRHQMGLQRLRVVVSGRAGITAQMGIAPEPPLVVSDLEPGYAVTLLIRLGVSEAEAPLLARQVGGNPLTLNVAARFFVRLDAQQRDAFLADPTGDVTGISAELRRAVLYDRFLEHIGDDDARRLAHPGLVLRRVTAPLIQEVLAPHCGLGKVNEQSARRMLDHLEDEVWLVTRTGDALRHRPEVRRPMLRMMMTDPEHAETARALHSAAHAWYDQGRDPEMRGAAARVEALYHWLMLQPEDAPVFGGAEDSRTTAAREGLDADQVRVLALDLGDAVEDLPRGIRAQVLAASGEELADEEVDVLPNGVFSHWLEAHGGKLVIADQPERALALWERRDRLGTPTWLARALLDSGRWQQFPAAALAEPSTYTLLAAAGSGRTDFLRRHAAKLTAWLSDPLALMDDTGNDKPFCASLLGFGFMPEGSGGVIPDERLGSVLEAAGPHVSSWLGARSRDRRQEVNPVVGLRHLLVGAYLGVGEPAFVRLPVAQLFRPDARWVRALFALTGGPLQSRSTDTGEAFVEKLETPKRSGPAPHAGDVLREWAVELAGLLGNDIDLALGHVLSSPEHAWILRGDNPELRPVTRRALAEAAVQTPRAFGVFGDAALSVLPVPVVDLEPTRLSADGALRPHETLSRLVEYVDRSGVLASFLVEVTARLPDAGLLARVRRLVTLWDAAHDRLIRAIQARSRTEQGKLQEGEA